MKFLEKNLEDIIYNNLEDLIERGLCLNLAPKQQMRRQLNLGYYGVADLVIMYFREPQDGLGEARFSEVLEVAVIECKKDVINIATYAQAKRYEAGLQKLISEYLNNKTVKVKFKTILIGKRVDLNNGFGFILKSDAECDVYTYDYKFNGIDFTWQDNFDIEGKFSEEVENMVFGFLDQSSAELQEYFSTISTPAKYE